MIHASKVREAFTARTTHTKRKTDVTERHDSRVELVAAILACLAAIAPPSSAEIITVCTSGCDYTSIIDAISNANDGDIIQLAAETYREHQTIEVHGRSLRLRGPSTPDGQPLAILDGQDQHRVLSVMNSSLDLENITIMHGNASPDDPLQGGGGVRVEASSIMMQDCVVSNSLGAPGGGMHLKLTTADLLRCRIHGNTTLNTKGKYPTGGPGGGLSQSDGVLSLQQCEVLGNYAWGTGGGIASDGELVIDECVIDGEAELESSQTWSALHCNQIQLSNSEIRASCKFDSGVVTDSEFANFNGPNYYGPCSCCGSSSPAILAGSTSFQSCTFYQLSATNSSPVWGGSAYQGCMFIDNRSGAGGYLADGSCGGALRSSDENAVLRDCVFTGNSAVYGGAVYGLNIIISNCTFRENTSYSNPDYCDTPITGAGGAIYGTGCQIVSCLFEGNESSGPGSAVAGNQNSSFGSVFCGSDTDWIAGDWQDFGENSFAKTCPLICPGDLDDDGFVSGIDLGMWLQHAGNVCDPGSPCPGDLDGDGEVRGSDLGLLLLNWGICD
jgi:predicted outer membrane repeat protein